MTWLRFASSLLVCLFICLLDCLFVWLCVYLSRCSRIGFFVCSFFEEKLNANQNSFQRPGIVFACGGLTKFEKASLNDRILPQFFSPAAANVEMCTSGTVSGKKIKN